MTDIVAFIGQAGTGKTTKIISELNRLLSTIEWDGNTSILALTFMHGSRRRLSAKLRVFAQKGVLLDCQTIDSFCFRLVQRYKRYLGISKLINISEFIGQDKFIETDSEIICGLEVIRQYAIKILSFDAARRSIAQSYPIIIIDEFQDCDGILLNFIQELSAFTQMIIGADDFQKLEKKNEKCEAVEWLKSKTKIIELTDFHRTSNQRLLLTARALRTNSPEVKGIEVIEVTSPALAAWNIAKYIAWKKWGLGSSKLAIISPTKLETDSFFKETIARLKLPFPNHSFPGTNVFIEGADSESALEIVNRLSNWADLKEVTYFNLAEWADLKDPVTKQACSRALRLLNLRGSDKLSKEEFAEIIGRQKHHLRVYGGNRFEAQKTALTVHQAKNREFDFVIVLWSYKNQGGDLYSRKMLYNAITRAKQDAIIIIQVNPSVRKQDSTIQLLHSKNATQTVEKVIKKAKRKKGDV